MTVTSSSSIRSSTVQQLCSSWQCTSRKTSYRLLVVTFLCYNRHFYPVMATVRKENQKTKHQSHVCYFLQCLLVRRNPQWHTRNVVKWMDHVCTVQSLLFKLVSSVFASFDCAPCSLSRTTAAEKNYLIHFLQSSNRNQSTGPRESTISNR